MTLRHPAALALVVSLSLGPPKDGGSIEVP
jgi:hypothetical protein